MTTSRSLISAMQVTLDGYSSEGNAEWVDSWADGLALLPPVDAFVLGGGMFPDYERFWATILDDPGAAADMLGRDVYPREIIDEFRANEGRVGDPFAGTPMIVIHHIGAKSGIERVTPLACAPQGDGRYAIVASNGGSLTHPDWYYNLKANPRIGVEVGTVTFTVLTEELEGTARDELWPRLVAAWPSLGAFETTAARRIPLLLLAREDRPADDESGSVTTST